jgi:hypothetical protein
LCPHEESEQITEVIKSFSIYLKESNLLIIQFKEVESLLLLAPRDPILELLSCDFVNYYKH